MISIQTHVIVAGQIPPQLPLIAWRLRPEPWQPSMMRELAALTARVQALELHVKQLKLAKDAK